MAQGTSDGSTNHSINQPIDQSIDQSFNQAIHQPIHAPSARRRSEAQNLRVLLRALLAMVLVLGFDADWMLGLDGFLTDRWDGTVGRDFWHSRLRLFREFRCCDGVSVHAAAWQHQSIDRDEMASSSVQISNAMPAHHRRRHSPDGYWRSEPPTDTPRKNNLVFSFLFGLSPFTCQSSTLSKSNLPPLFQPKCPLRTTQSSRLNQSRSGGVEAGNSARSRALTRFLSSFTWSRSSSSSQRKVEAAATCE